MTTRLHLVRELDQLARRNEGYVPEGDSLDFEWLATWQKKVSKAFWISVIVLMVCVIVQAQEAL